MGLVDRVRPRAFVMENVKALAQNQRWTGLINKLRDSAESKELGGYSTTLLLLKASDYGVPQARERMFLIGIRDSTEDFVPPPPTTRDRPRTLRSALESLPRWREPGNDTICTAKVTPAKTPVMRRSPFAGMVFNGQGRPMDLDAPAPTLPASMGGNRTPIIDQLELDEGVECWVRRYHAELWAGRDPVSVVPKRMRRITVEEAAAIQTFPPLMPWMGRQSSHYRQIGNAVPPLLGYAVARSIRNQLGIAAFKPPRQLLGLPVPGVE
jgi:DNA (cytosine-5)-methyltransferase 1